MDALDRLQWIYTIIAILGAIVLAVGLTGEVLGWWQDMGIILSAIGIVATGLGAVAAIGISATKRQAKTIASAVLAGNQKLDQANGKLDIANHQLEQLDSTVSSKMDEQTRLLREIRDRLPIG